MTLRSPLVVHLAPVSAPRADPAPRRPDLGALLRGRRLIVVSNREPVMHVRRAGRIEAVTPASGLTTAVAPLLASCGGSWVAHGSGDADFDVADAAGVYSPRLEGRPVRLRRVRLPPEVERGYYDGLSNEGLWPLCHIAYTAPVFRARDWEQYRAANRAFAEAVLAEVGREPAMVLVHDFHLALLPRLLRRARPDLLIGHFWHIPWPSREVMRICPWIDELLDGLLGNDLFALHVGQHCANFLDTVDRGIEALVDPEHRSARRLGHTTYVRHAPISIDVDAFSTAARALSVEEAFPELVPHLDGKLVLLGVDRLDYTKGIPQRLRAVEALLERRPDLLERLVLVQVGAPTRTTVRRFRDLAQEVDALVQSVNARFGRRGWLPVRYLAEHHDRLRLAPLMRRADACLVTSLHDGMNLVSKEYVAARAGLPGSLVLSKFTGAARELPEACLINPYDIDGTAALLAETLDLSEERRLLSMQRMLARIQQHDVYRWGAEILRGLDEVARRTDAKSFPGN